MLSVLLVLMSIMGVILIIRSKKHQSESSDSLIMPPDKPTFIMPITREMHVKKLVKSNFKGDIVVFFDIDGVIHRNQNESLERKDKLADMIKVYPTLDLVMCSNWRESADMEWFEGKLGPELAAHFTGCTPLMPACEYRREREIKLFIREHNVRSYVIFDDQANLYSEHCENLIITDKSTALTDQDVVNAVTLLGKQK